MQSLIGYICFARCDFSQCPKRKYTSDVRTAAFIKNKTNVLSLEFKVAHDHVKEPQ